MKNKALLRRLKYYGFGFGLGLVVVWASLLKDRDRASWLPEGRTLEFLAETEIGLNDVVKCQINCFGLDSDFMNESFWKKADLDFDKSATKRDPCPEYYITSELPNGTPIAVYIETCEYCEDCEEERTAFLRNIELGTKKCDC